MPEAFRVTLFNGSRDNDEVKKPRVFIPQTNYFFIYFLQTCTRVMYVIYPDVNIPKCEYT